MKFTDRTTYKENTRLGLCAGWDEYCHTPAGRYTISFLEYTRKPAVFLAQFKSKKIGEFAEEKEAKAAAQNHFNALVRQCQQLVTE